jgi:hypothetical protein
MSYKSSKLSSNESHLPYTTPTQVESRALDIENEQQVSHYKAANALEFLNVMAWGLLLPYTKVLHISWQDNYYYSVFTPEATTRHL